MIWKSFTDLKMIWCFKMEEQELKELLKICLDNMRDNVFRFQSIIDSAKGGLSATTQALNEVEERLRNDK